MSMAADLTEPTDQGNFGKELFRSLFFRKVMKRRIYIKVMAYHEAKFNCEIRIISKQKSPLLCQLYLLVYGGYVWLKLKFSKTILVQSLNEET